MIKRETETEKVEIEVEVGRIEMIKLVVELFVSRLNKLLELEFDIGIREQLSAA